MKNLIYFLLPLIFASCAGDSKVDPFAVPGETATIMVRLAGAEPGRAVGLPNPANESLISTGMIFVFRGGSLDPVLDGSEIFDFTGGNTVVPVTITSGANREVFVVANVNPADFATVTKRSDLYNLVNKLQLASLRTGTNLAMSGYVLNVDASAATTTSPVPVTVQLFFVGSRVSIAWDLSGLPAPLASMVVTGVYLLNVKSQSDYFAPNGNLLTDNVLFYLYGRSSIAGFSGDYLPQTPATNTYDPALNLTDLVAGANFNNHFYVFENNANYPTIVVIETLFEGTAYFYPIVINGSQNSGGTGDGTSTVRRGNIYNVTALISGLGATDPYAPLVSGVLNVTIVPAAWNPVIPIIQEFN